MGDQAETRPYLVESREEVVKALPPAPEPPPLVDGERDGQDRPRIHLAAIEDRSVTPAPPAGLAALPAALPEPTERRGVGWWWREREDGSEWVVRRARFEKKKYMSSTLQGSPQRGGDSPVLPHWLIDPVVQVPQRQDFEGTQTFEEASVPPSGFPHMHANVFFAHPPGLDHILSFSADAPFLDDGVAGFEPSLACGSKRADFPPPLETRRDAA
jgi:hypothetical protein